MRHSLRCLTALLLAGVLLLALLPHGAAEEERFLLSFAGDCTFGTDYRTFSMESCFPTVVQDDYDYPFANVRSYFEEDDFTMVNLEGVLLDSGFSGKQGFAFRGSTGYVNILTRGSVEAVTVANNHTKDFGQEGYESTINTLREAGMPYVEGDSCIVYTTERGLKLGLYACNLTIGMNQIAAGLTLDKMEQDILDMRRNGAEIIIMAIHWGVEGSHWPIIEQTNLAHELIDRGVDIVYGCHPHVLQKIETYGSGIIYYSLGNFSFGGNHWPDDLDTAIIQQEIIRDENGTRLGNTIPIPASVTSTGTGKNNFQPTPYPEDSMEYQRAMSKLNGTY